MKRIKVYKQGIVTHQAEESTSGFGLKAGEADLWVAKCIESGVFGAPSEYTIVEEDITSELERQRINQESLALLASTDWYVVRQLETGVEIPKEVLEARIQARLRIIR